MYRGAREKGTLQREGMQFLRLQSSNPQLTAGSHHSFNARPSASANRLNAMSDKAISYPMCCLSILNHRVPSSPLPAAYARTLHGTMVFQQRERKRKTISRQMRPPQKVSHSAGPSSWKAGSRATVQPQSRFKPLAVFLLMHMDIIRDI